MAVSDSYRPGRGAMRGLFLPLLVIFGIFIAFVGKSPAEVYGYIYKGGFSSSFAWQNTLARAAQ